MRTAVQETAPKIALRNCSKKAVGGKSIYKVLVKAKFNIFKHSFCKRFSASCKQLMSS